MSSTAIAFYSATRPSRAEQKPTICVVSKASAQGTALVADVVRQQAGAAALVETFATVRTALANPATRPRCLLVDARWLEAMDFVRWVRDDVRLCDTPVILLAAKPTEEVFLAARRCGADDAVGIDDAAGIARRTKTLAAFVPGVRPAPVLGVALVVHSNDERRRHAGWILRRAGYEIVFAKTCRDAVTMGRERLPAVVVVSADLLEQGDLTAALCRLRTDIGHEGLPMVVVAADGARHRMQIFLSRVALASDGQDWDHLLFQISEVTRPAVADLRASRRVFWATIIGFRRLTELEPSLGLTYDVSQGGLFVRTTDAPASGDLVNLDLRLAAISPQVLTLRARVVWVQQLRPGVATRTPAGFGAEIVPDDCPRADLGLYRSACAALVASNQSPTMPAAAS